MAWCGCSRKCTRCQASRGDDADGWSACALTLCTPLPRRSSQALPRFLGDVSRCVVGAKSWQLLPQPLLALAQRGDALPHRCHMLADGEVKALYESGVDL